MLGLLHIFTPNLFLYDGDFLLFKKEVETVDLKLWLTDATMTVTRIYLSEPFQPAAERMITKYFAFSHYEVHRFRAVVLVYYFYVTGCY